jgi:hypothetical protein
MQMVLSHNGGINLVFLMPVSSMALRVAAFQTGSKNSIQPSLLIWPSSYLPIASQSGCYQCSGYQGGLASAFRFPKTESGVAVRPIAPAPAPVPAAGVETPSFSLPLVTSA